LQTDSDDQGKTQVVTPVAEYPFTDISYRLEEPSAAKSVILLTSQHQAFKAATAATKKLGRKVIPVVFVPTVAQAPASGEVEVKISSASGD
jgi:hypothetical protein